MDMSSLVELTEDESKITAKGLTFTVTKEKDEASTKPYLRINGKGIIPHQKVRGFRLDEAVNPPRLYLDYEGPASPAFVGEVTSTEDTYRWIKKANLNYPYSNSKK